MSDSFSAASGSSPKESGAPGASLAGLARVLLYLSLAAAFAAIAYAQFQSVQAKSLLQKSQDTLSSEFGVAQPTHKHLAPDYTDKDQRLVADPPTEVNKQLDPDTIVVAYGEDSDLDVQPIDWQEFQLHLATATGKKVEMQVYQNSGDDVAAVKAGQTHVVALHAADTPYLVNNAGFIPVAVVGTDAGAEGNRLDLGVRANSNIQKLADLKGRNLTCSMPASITGHRAAVAVLLQESSLRPDIDYTVSFSGGQKKSVLGLAGGEFEAAALSDDKVQSLLKSGRIKQSDYRIVYQSQVIPRFTIGYVYNLQPQLAAKVSQAILDFKNEAGPVGELSGKPLHFVAANYKQDFEFVRKIDESFDPRLGPKPQKAKTESAVNSAET
jgi:phosphonate transport system substrate-binding protein